MYSPVRRHHLQLPSNIIVVVILPRPYLPTNNSTADRGWEGKGDRHHAAGQRFPLAPIHGSSFVGHDLMHHHHHFTASTSYATTVHAPDARDLSCETIRYDAPLGSARAFRFVHVSQRGHDVGQ
jgi:hypothetical protein